MLSPKLSVLDMSVGGRADLRMVDSSRIGWLVVLTINLTRSRLTWEASH